MNRDKILADYYRGAYGPTLRFEVWGPTNLARLRGLFLQLAGSHVSEVELATREDFFVSSLMSLVLKREDSRTYNPASSIVVKAGLGDDPSKTRLVWLESGARWACCAELLDSFRGVAAHQYLIEEGRDRSLVEVSFDGG